MLSPATEQRPTQNPRPFLLEDPQWKIQRARWRRLVGMSLLAVLAAALLAWAGAAAFNRWQFERGYRAVLCADLERLAVAQRDFYGANSRYGTLSELGRTFVAAQGVTLAVEASSQSWTAVAWHQLIDTKCQATLAQHDAAPTIACP